MFNIQWRARHSTGAAVAATAVVWMLGVSQVSAQEHGKWQPLQVIEVGTRSLRGRTDSARFRGYLDPSPTPDRRSWGNVAS